MKEKLLQHTNLMKLHQPKLSKLMRNLLNFIYKNTQSTNATMDIPIKAFITLSIYFLLSSKSSKRAEAINPPVIPTIIMINPQIPTFTFISINHQ